ncbi:MAG: hypothetical protein H6Q73_885 [Firmicutes bacterium]|nr:hypothetical protein [Bacillota bacterium]
MNQRDALKLAGLQWQYAGYKWLITVVDDIQAIKKYLRKIRTYEKEIAKIKSRPGRRLGAVKTAAKKMSI